MVTFNSIINFTLNTLLITLFTIKKNNYLRYMSNQVINLDHLDKEATIYKQKKQELIQRAENVKTTLLQNTKNEVEDVQNAINNLNKKIETIMNTDVVINEKNNIQKCQNRMALSIELAAKAFFKIRGVIHSKDNLSIQQKREYERKVYEKIISKFLTQEEIKEFERMIKENSIMIMPRNRIGGVSM